jgi:hypothetical protein
MSFLMRKTQKIIIGLIVNANAALIAPHPDTTAPIHINLARNIIRKALRIFRIMSVSFNSASGRVKTMNTIVSTNPNLTAMIHSYGFDTVIGYRCRIGRIRNKESLLFITPINAQEPLIKTQPHHSQRIN